MPRALTKPMRTVLQNVANDRRIDDGLTTISTATMPNGVPVRITAAKTVIQALVKRGYLRQTQDARYRITPAGLEALELSNKQTN